MSFVLKIHRDPYHTGVNLTTAREIEFLPGLTVLAGCNGSGKSTLLKSIKEFADKEKIPCKSYDNVSDGRNSFADLYVSGLGDENDRDLMFLAFESSEGEIIRLNMIKQMNQFSEFLDSGIVNKRRSALAAVFGGRETKKPETEKRILLFDGIDSGSSVDAVLEYKILFRNLIDRAEAAGKELYIIVAANSFEMCVDEICVNVQNGKQVNFGFFDYLAYRSFVLDTRAKKDKRLEKEQEKAKKQEEKEEKK